MFANTQDFRIAFVFSTSKVTRFMTYMIILYIVNTTNWEHTLNYFGKK